MRQTKSTSHGHTVTLLPDAKVLVAGGARLNSSLTSISAPLRLGHVDLDRHRHSPHGGYFHGDVAVES
jgi:hypothetical protein